MRQSVKTITLIMLFAFAAGTVHAFPWTRDFYDQDSHKAQEGTILNEPKGAVTTKGNKYLLTSREDAQKLKNPVTEGKDVPNPRDIEKGMAAYERYCLVCHGATGLGEGPVGKKFEENIMSPTSLVGDYVQSKPDGDIFYTITKGGQIAMPSYGDLVPEDDRWNIITYIKHELKNKGGN